MYRANTVIQVSSCYMIFSTAICLDLGGSCPPATACYGDLYCELQRPLKTALVATVCFQSLGMTLICEVLDWRIAGAPYRLLQYCLSLSR